MNFHLESYIGGVSSVKWPQAFFFLIPWCILLNISFQHLFVKSSNEHLLKQTRIIQCAKQLQYNKFQAKGCTKLTPCFYSTLPNDEVVNFKRDCSLIWTFIGWSFTVKFVLVRYFCIEGERTTPSIWEKILSLEWFLNFELLSQTCHTTKLAVTCSCVHLPPLIFFPL